MTKVKLRPTITHDKGVFIVPFLIPSWCSSCPAERKELKVEQGNKPTLEEIKTLLELEDYEIED